MSSSEVSRFADSVEFTVAIETSRVLGINDSTTTF